MIWSSYLEHRIRSLDKLGNAIDHALNGTGSNATVLDLAMEKQFKLNPWFTIENQRRALKEWSGLLTVKKLEEWVSSYPEVHQLSDPVSIGIIMAGNMPMVGFHDLLTVLISGNMAVVKLSSKDSELYYFITNLLKDTDKELASKVSFTDGILPPVDGVIATGSNNSSRYFQYYFGKYPNIIRRNRNSVAIITGDETDEELELLADDIFAYFGLGCRNVSKLYIPAGYDPSLLIGKWRSWSYLANHNKYANNLDYYKAIMLVNREPFTDGGFFLLRENGSFASPVSIINYSVYTDIKDVITDTSVNQNVIQCIIGKGNLPFGTAQSPTLSDYADNIDTFSFVLKLKNRLIN